LEISPSPLAEKGARLKARRPLQNLRGVHSSKTITIRFAVKTGVIGMKKEKGKRFASPFDFFG
jgi:hypothetical protein